MHIEDENLQMKKLDEEMFEEYVKYRNLDKYLSQDSSPEWQQRIEDLAREYFVRLSETSKKKDVPEEEKPYDILTQQLTKTNLNINKRGDKKKVHDSNPSKFSTLVGYSQDWKKSSFQKDCLDFDEMIKVELPEKYNAEMHDPKLTSLGLILIDHRKRVVKKEKIEDSISRNDDFNLFLCLLRKKKEQEVEKVPYYSDFNLTLEDVYNNEKDKFNDEEADKKSEEKIDNFIKKFINYEVNLNNN